MKSSQSIHRDEYEVPRFLVPSIDLKVEFGQSETLITNRSHYSRNALDVSGENSLILDADQSLIIDSIHLNERKLDQSDYSRVSSSLRIEDVPDQFTLTTVTRVNPTENKSLLGLYSTERVICSHFEANGFRKITIHPDRPDVVSKFHVELVGDEQDFPVLLSNGNRTTGGYQDNGKHAAIWSDPFAKPSYLFAMVAGKLSNIEKSFETRSGRNVIIRLHASEEKISECEYALQTVPLVMKWDEDRYDLEYDLSEYNLVGVKEHNFGAMENKSLNIFSEANLVAGDGQHATDEDFKRIRVNVAHEYLHNWTGNRVTCRDWFQLALKEGLTTLRHCEFEQHIFGVGSSRIGQVKTMLTKQLSEDRGGNAHAPQPSSYLEVANLYTVTVYNKSAEIFRMMQRKIGQDLFAKCVTEFLKKYDGTGATIEEFVSHSSDVSGVDLESFVSWFQTPGTPVVEVRTKFVREEGRYTIEVTQSANEGSGSAKNITIPLEFALFDRGGNKLNLQEYGQVVPLNTEPVLLVNGDKNAVELDGLGEEPILSINRGFSAPVEVRFDRGPNDDIVLLAHEDDAVSQWMASRRLFSSRILGSSEVWSPDVDANWKIALEKILLKSSDDPETAALLLEIPTDKETSNFGDHIQVDHILSSTASLRAELGIHLTSILWKILEDQTQEEVYLPTPKQMASRRFVNVVIDYLFSSNNAVSDKLCFDRSIRSNNLTDRTAALGVINRSTTPMREEAFQKCYNDWRENPLVLDKWFQLQALKPSNDSVSHVQKLMSDPAFNLENLSRVKSLLGWFFLLNFQGFHVSTGEGYQFFHQCLLEIDQKNSTAAAWFLRRSDLMRWCVFDDSRSRQMKSVLSDLDRNDRISNGLKELIGNAYEGEQYA